MKHCIQKKGFLYSSLCIKKIYKGFLLCSFLFMQQPTEAAEIISIGRACNVARSARYNGLRSVAYPLDWTITSYQTLKSLFENDFQNILIPEQIQMSEDKKSVSDEFGLIYIHDFPTVRYPVAPIDGEIMPVHQLAPHWQDAIPVVQAKFKRRIDRMFQLLRTGKPVALVRYDDMNQQQAKEFLVLLKKKFPQAKVILVVIGCTPDFQKPWNIPHVKNMYIDKEYYKDWDGPVWTDVMHKIAALNPDGWEDEVCQKSYVLTLPVYNAGFFSNFNTVLGVLDHYDRGVIDGLRIDFEDKGWYYDSEKGTNWWQYYFDPIALGDQSDYIQEDLFPTYQKIEFAYGSQFEMSRERANELIRKYIHVRPHIAKKVDKFCAENFKDFFVIGVHYRGTDKLEAEPVSYQTVIENIQTVMISNNNKNIKIFVATDDARFAKYIKTQFPNKLIMRDALRNDNETGVHMCDFNPYKKGEDAIIDCLLLSKCSILIKMASNLSDSSLKFNPDIPVIKLNKSYSE